MGGGPIFFMKMGATSSIPLVHAPEHNHCRRGYCLPLYLEAPGSQALPALTAASGIQWFGFQGPPNGRKRIYSNLMVNYL